MRERVGKRTLRVCSSGTVNGSTVQSRLFRDFSMGVNVRKWHFSAILGLCGVRFPLACFPPGRVNSIYTPSQHAYTEQDICLPMNKRLFPAFLGVLLIFSVVAAHAQKRDRDDDDDDDHPALRPPALRPGEKTPDAAFSCPYARSYERPERLDGFTIRLRHGSKTPTDRCRAVITSPKGTVTAAAKDWSLTIDKISGADINGDGKPELVIAGYSGGEHCCFTYTVIGLGRTPQLIRKIQSRSHLDFEKQKDGTILIEGDESSLDYFLVPHPMAVVPKVFLKMQGDQLVDVSDQFRSEYDKLIDQARSQLTPADLERFRGSRYNDKMFTDQLPTVRNVLIIVLNYLYSGREEQGWKALDDFWPASDRNRVRNLIMQRRGRGLLAQLNASDSLH